MQENFLRCLNPNKQKQCLKGERCWTMKRKYKMEHHVKEVKIVQHCILLTIAKNENISKQQ